MVDQTPSGTPGQDLKTTLTNLVVEQCEVMEKHRADLQKEYDQLRKEIEDPRQFEKAKDRMESVASSLTKSSKEDLVKKFTELFEEISNSVGGQGVQKVEIGNYLDWYQARDRAVKEGGRLPTVEDLRNAEISVGGDIWIPITATKGDQETGRRDGFKGNGENCWCNVGDRKYQTEYPSWGLTTGDHDHVQLKYLHITKGKSTGASMEEVAKNPKKYALILSGHNDYPACNGKYLVDGEQNGKIKWTKEAGIHLLWTGHSWDCYCGRYSPESTSNTPVPPLTGYDKDKGSTEIVVKYELI